MKGECERCAAPIERIRFRKYCFECAEIRAIEADIRYRVSVRERENLARRRRRAKGGRNERETNIDCSNQR
jgi:hypothetical protein